MLLPSEPPGKSLDTQNEDEIRVLGEPMKPVSLEEMDTTELLNNNYIYMGFPGG